MIKYKIEEVKKTLMNGEVESVFYIYRDYLFSFWRKYQAHFYVTDFVKTEFKSLSDALSEVRILEERNKRDFAKKVKKTETIIHKTEINCTGNNGNGCYMDSCGHSCGCEGILENLTMQGRRANNTKFLRALIYNFGKKIKTENDGNKN